VSFVSSFGKLPLLKTTSPKYSKFSTAFFLYNIVKFINYPICENTCTPWVVAYRVAVCHWERYNSKGCRVNTKRGASQKINDGDSFSKKWHIYLRLCTLRSKMPQKFDCPHFGIVATLTSNTYFQCIYTLVRLQEDKCGVSVVSTWAFVLLLWEYTCFLDYRAVRVYHLLHRLERFCLTKLILWILSF